MAEFTPEKPKQIALVRLDLIHKKDTNLVKLLLGIVMPEMKINMVLSFQTQIKRSISNIVMSFMQQGCFHIIELVKKLLSMVLSIQKVNHIALRE
jgi:hypothetical protein